MFIRLSHKIDENTPFYGGRKGFNKISTSSIEKGDSANTQTWELPNHLGTHMDFPFHFYKNGQTLDDFLEDFWIFDGKKIQLLEINLPEKEFLINPNHIKKHSMNPDAEFLILKTGHGKYRNNEKFWKYNPGISIEMADWIVDKFKKIKMIGIDSISISSWQHRDIGRQVHKKMLNPKKPILIIEDMDLSKIDNDSRVQKMFIAPLMIKKSDGAPCTIFAEVK